MERRLSFQPTNSSLCNASSSSLGRVGERALASFRGGVAETSFELPAYPPRVRVPRIRPSQGRLRATATSLDAELMRAGLCSLGKHQLLRYALDSPRVDAAHLVGEAHDQAEVRQSVDLAGNAGSQDV